MGRAIFEASSAARKITDILKDAKVGDVVSYEAMQKACGFDVQKNRHLIYTAMRRVQNELRFVFGVVVNVGYRLLSDGETVESSEQRIKRIRKQSRIGAKRLACVNYAQMNDQSKLLHNVNMTVFCLVQGSTSSSNIKRIADAVKSSGNALNAAKAASVALQHIK